MKVLFVCQRNNGRSQMAKAIYNKLTNGSDASGAGVTVDKPGQLLRERAQEEGSDVARVIEVMAEIGIDVSDSPRLQLDTSQLTSYDKVVVLLEPDRIPEDVKSAPNVTIWSMPDPKSKDTAGLRIVRDDIFRRVEALLSR